MPSLKKMNSLWVCWNLPRFEVPEDALVLSFASPKEDLEIEQKFAGRHLRGSKLSQEIRDEARRFYVHLVALIGAAPCADGRTLRELLRFRHQKNSLWWYHPISFKNNITHPLFNQNIIIMTISWVMKKYNVRRIYFENGDHEIYDVLKSKFHIEKVSIHKKKPLWMKIIRGVLSRGKHFITACYYILMTGGHENAEIEKIDVALFGFWDWSIKLSKTSGELEDRYYGNLTGELEDNGKKWVHLLWLDPFSEAGSRGRRLSDVLSPLRRRNDAILLHSFLRLRDAFVFFLDFRPLVKFLSVWKETCFKSLFVYDGMNFIYLFQDDLFYFYFNATFPLLRLTEEATERAVRKFRPKVFLNFMEFFPTAKASYIGVKRADGKIPTLCLQHGTRSSESTFFCFDPKLEYDGEGDGCIIPKPDHCFAMGELGKQLLAGNGYPADRLFLTGNPRYDHLRVMPIRKQKEKGDRVVLLFAASGTYHIELQALEAAICAVKDLPFVRLVLREHFFYKLSQYPPAKKMTGEVEISRDTLDYDLDLADIVFFTSTTVAEEAYLRGKPVWQWVTPNSNLQAFRDIPVIRRYFSIEQLRGDLLAFHNEPENFFPAIQSIRNVEKQCFHRCDGKAALRIAEVLSQKFI